MRQALLEDIAMGGPGNEMADYIDAFLKESRNPRG
jgi:hypothetical protein